MIDWQIENKIRQIKMKLKWNWNKIWESRFNNIIAYSKYQSNIQMLCFHNCDFTFVLDEIDLDDMKEQGGWGIPSDMILNIAEIIEDELKDDNRIKNGLCNLKALAVNGSCNIQHMHVIPYRILNILIGISITVITYSRWCK